MALPTIIFNAASGSDTAASGAGPATALFGTAASLNSSTTVDLSADAPDLSGVATDGSAALWVDTTSGRQFSPITGVDNTAKTVTVSTTYSVTESGRNWGIGGKRKLIDNADSLTLFGATGATLNWIIELEDDQSISAVITLNTALDGATIRGAGGALKTITQTANDETIQVSSANVRFQWLKFINTNGTKTNAQAIEYAGSSTCLVESCQFGDGTNHLHTGLSTAIPDVSVINCCFIGCTSAAISASGTGVAFVSGSFFKDNAAGFVGSNANLIFLDSIFSGTTGKAIDSTNGSLLRVIIQGNTFDGGGDDAVEIDNPAPAIIFLRNNIFSNTTGWGVDFTALTTDSAVTEDFNAYYNNSSGSVNGITIGANSIEGTDPQYVNAAGENFEIGTNLAGLGYPDKDLFIGVNQSATNTFIDIGAAQREETGGGGGGSFTFS